MQVEHHDLPHDFPEYKEDIHALKAGDHHFARLFEKYTGITLNVERLEQDDVPVDDFTIEDMKKERIRLKDELYAMLRAHKLGRQG
jgi:uncharacterized protein YdcH (DUF465 family)